MTMTQQQHNDDALQRAIDFITSDYYLDNTNGVKDALAQHLDADHLYNIEHNITKLQQAVNLWNTDEEIDIVVDEGIYLQYYATPVDFCKNTRHDITNSTLAEAMYQVMFLCMMYAGLKRHYIKYQAQTGLIDEQQQLVELLAV